MSHFAFIFALLNNGELVDQASSVSSDDWLSDRRYECKTRYIVFYV